MKTLIIYSSQTGFTEKYANWIADELKCEILPLKKAKSTNLSEYDTIIYGGWCCAGSVNGIKWISSKLANILSTANKKVAVFAVGASPMENPDLNVGMQNIFTNLAKSVEGKNLKSDFFKSVNLFYCPGGFNYDKMNTASKLAMKMFLKMLKSNKNKTEKDEQMIKMISSSYDISDKKYIKPILDFVK